MKKYSEHFYNVTKIINNSKSNIFTEEMHSKQNGGIERTISVQAPKQ